MMHNILQGNGIDMYDFLPDLTLADTNLIPTGKKFWVGVQEGMRPSPPIPRRRTRSFVGCDVYLYNNQKVFKTSNDDFYKIPEHEERFIMS